MSIILAQNFKDVFFKTNRQTISKLASKKEW
jgi:hypothetical protein